MWWWVDAHLPQLIAISLVFIFLSSWKIAHDQTQGTRNAAYDNRLASQSACIRGNESRTAQVDALLDQADGNEARANAWRELKESPLPAYLDSFVRGQVKANTSEATESRENARRLVRSQAAVSLHPNSPDPRRRAMADCVKIYPLSEERGDELPEPVNVINRRE